MEDQTVSESMRPGLKQDLAIYFDSSFADVLETWGVGNVWTEIQILMGARKGRVLDIACGTGRTYDFLKRFEDLEYHGCDISNLLIERAYARGILESRARVADATCLPYENNSFDFVFSIGSIEHFTESGIEAMLTECRRVCRGLGFHQFPVSIREKDEGWISPYQSYWNNSETWWMEKFEKIYGSNIIVMPSRWSDALSRGVWFITYEPGWIL